jgi:hypothetical protein
MGGYSERLPEGCCHQNARCMAERHPELAYVEGYLVFPLAEPFGDYRLEHAWNETPDGTIVDSTAWPYDPPFRYEAAPRP